MRSKGWVVPKIRNKTTGELESGNIIYVLGTVDGKFYRKSTGKEATQINISWIKKNHRDVLLKLIDKKEKTSKTLLKEYGIRVIEATSRVRNKNSQKEKLAYFNNHILPYFESKKIIYIEDIKTTDVEIWQNNMLKQRSSSTVKKCKDTLSLIMSKAEADDIIHKNYVNYSEPIKLITEKRVPYTEIEIRTLLKESEGWFKIFLYVLFSTGIRTGEALALSWEDIDFENGFIDLKRSVTKGIITTEKGNCSVDEFIKNCYEVKINNNTNKTKNHTRIIPLDKITLQLLYNFYENKNHEYWIFPSKYGKCFTETKNINKYYWKPLLFKTKIENKQLYTARHTYISIMKNNGSDTSWLKEVIGHKQSSKVMEDNYFSFDKSRLHKANNFFYNLNKEENTKC